MEPQDATLLGPLTALERALRVGACCPPQRVEALLHPDFCEVGQSGRVWSRAEVVALLAQPPHASAPRSDQFALALLGPGVALLTYHSWHPAPEGPRAVQHASIWLLGDSGWRLRYHQGTPGAQRAPCTTSGSAAAGMAGTAGTGEKAGATA